MRHVVVPVIAFALGAASRLARPGATDRDGEVRPGRQPSSSYVAEVDTGRGQKFRPRSGANQDYLVARPVVPVWQSGT
jgi:hypothetical protein